MKIKIRDLHFAYGDNLILKGTTFFVPQGSFVGIIGPNGSGKSTLLKLISRVLAPSGGSVLLSDRDLAEFSQRDLAKTMAVVSQDPQFAYQFSAGDIVMMGRSPYLGRFQSESAEDLNIVRAALEMTGCLHLRERLITELSGGERQRVMIARALAQQPKILLLDEPTSHLDIGYQQEILDLVKRLSTTGGLTVVAVLHDLNVAAYYCNELILISGGSIYACGAPADVLTAENIGAVYRTRVLVTPHPLLGTPVVSQLPSLLNGENKEKKPHLHLLAGGGSGGELLRDLADAGYELSAGVLNTGDSDWETARALNVPVVSEAPFSYISPARHQENLRWLEKAAAVILAEIPIGQGNLLNLQAALTALRQGKPLFMLEEKKDRKRDFTGGEGEALLEEIKKGGACVFGDKAGLYGALAVI